MCVDEVTKGNVYSKWKLEAGTLENVEMVGKGVGVGCAKSPNAQGRAGGGEASLKRGDEV